MPSLLISFLCCHGFHATRRPAVDTSSERTKIGWSRCPSGAQLRHAGSRRRGSYDDRSLLGCIPVLCTFCINSQVNRQDVGAVEGLGHAFNHYGLGNLSRLWRSFQYHFIVHLKDRSVSSARFKTRYCIWRSKNNYQIKGQQSELGMACAHLHSINSKSREHTPILKSSTASGLTRQNTDSGVAWHNIRTNYYFLVLRKWWNPPVLRKLPQHIYTCNRRVQPSSFRRVFLSISSIAHMATSAALPCDVKKLSISVYVKLGHFFYLTLDKIYLYRSIDSSTLDVLPLTTSQIGHIGETAWSSKQSINFRLLVC